MHDQTNFYVVNRDNDRAQLFSAYLSYETTSTFSDARSIDVYDYDYEDELTNYPKVFYTQTHNFDYDSNENWLVFKALDGRYDINIFNAGQGINPTLAVYDDNGNLIIKSDTGLTGENEGISIYPGDLPEVEYYYIKITNSETEFNNETHYDIRVSYDSLRFYNDPPEDIFVTGLVIDKCNNNEITFANIDYGYGITDSGTRGAYSILLFGNDEINEITVSKSGYQEKTQLLTGEIFGQKASDFYLLPDAGCPTIPVTPVTPVTPVNILNTARYDDLTKTLIIDDVMYESDHYQAELVDSGDFTFSLKSASKLEGQALQNQNIFDLATSSLKLNKVFAFGKYYKVVLKHLGDFVFKLESAEEILE